MKNFPPLIAILFLFFGCIPEEIEIQREKRILISGKVTAKDRNALSNIPVATFGVLRENTFISSEFQERLGYHSTSGTGDFSFISLDVKNGHIAVTVNSTFSNLYNENYATAHFEEGEGTRGLGISLRNIILPAILDFTIKIENTSGTSAELAYVIIFKDKEQYFRFMPNGQPHVELPNRYNGNGIEGNHTASEGTTNDVISTLEDSEIIFRYKIGEGESNELIIPVTSQSNEYVFQY